MEHTLNVGVTEPNSFIFEIKNNKIVINENGFHYNGKIINDNGEIYEQFKEFLKTIQLPQQEMCISCDEEKETHEICMDCIGKMIKENQQEISDEEIEEEISKRYMQPTMDYAFRDGCKWYREQLKRNGNGYS